MNLLCLSYTRFLDCSELYSPSHFLSFRCLCWSRRDLGEGRLCPHCSEGSQLSFCEYFSNQIRFLARSGCDRGEEAELCNVCSQGGLRSHEELVWVSCVQNCQKRHATLSIFKSLILVCAMKQPQEHPCGRLGEYGSLQRWQLWHGRGRHVQVRLGRVSHFSSTCILRQNRCSTLSYS